MIKIVSKWLQSAAEGGCAALGEKARRLLRLITDQELTFKEHSDQLYGKWASNIVAQLPINS